MPGTSTDDTRRDQSATAQDIRHLAGAISDHTVMEILGLAPTFGEVETAVIHARGEGSRIDRAGHTLSGAAAEVFDILTRDDLYVNEGGN